MYFHLLNVLTHLLRIRKKVIKSPYHSERYSRKHDKTRMATFLSSEANKSWNEKTDKVSFRTVHLL